MNIVLDNGSPVTGKMSVVGHNVEAENEVKTMTPTSEVASSGIIGQADPTPLTPAQAVVRPVRSSAHYTASERFVAGIGLALLRWSNRRADRAQPTHARMALLLENERVRASHAPFASTSGR